MRGQAERAHVERMYFRIGEAAQIVGERPHVLRYWESEFRCIRPTKSASGQRVYSRRDIDTLLKIKTLLKDQRFTIEGAKRRLREGGLEPADPSDPNTAEVKHLRSILLDLRHEAASLLHKWECEA